MRYIPIIYTDMKPFIYTENFGILIQFHVSNQILQSNIFLLVKQYFITLKCIAYLCIGRFTEEKKF